MKLVRISSVSNMGAPSQLTTVFESMLLGGLYIVLSAGLITFNKSLLAKDRFPHALHLTAIHMMVTTLFSCILYACAPQLYPTMQNALENKGKVLKYIAPLGLMFSIALFCSNQAYQYSSVAFLQFCKEGNVALVFFLSCLIGLQTFSWEKVGVLSVVVMGCSLCAHGEIHFVMWGLALQLTSQVAESSKNLTAELVMSGAGMKLDVLTFVSWQAPCSLIPLLFAISMSSSNMTVLTDLGLYWPHVLGNASLAFLLNVAIAMTLKRLSTLAFVIIGIVKDIVIVAASAAVFHDPISNMQVGGFAVTICGIAMWGHLKMREAAKAAENKEKDPLMPKKQQDSKV